MTTGDVHQSVTYSTLIAEALSRHGDRVAFICDGTEMSYDEASALTSKMMQLLSALGVGHGDGVAALGPNTAELWLIQAAAYLLGARFTGLNALGSTEDHAHIIDDAEIKVLLTTASHAEAGARVTKLTTSIVSFLTLGDATYGDNIYPMIEPFEPLPLAARHSQPEDVCWLQYTGGTTGTPKGVMLTQGSMAQQVQTWLASYGVPHYPRYLAASPITHAAVLSLLPTLVRGGTVVLLPRFDPGTYLKAIQDHRINYAFAVPTMLYSLLDYPELSRFDLSSLETIVYGAAPISPNRFVEARETFGDVLLQGYAQTETSAVLMTLRQHEHAPESIDTLKYSCGRPAVGITAAILDEDGNEVSAATLGEICVRSPAVMKGYWKRPELTQTVIRDGWLHTGDVGYRDDRGYYYIVDRLKDLIITGGFNVYPKEVEDALVSHPAVSAAAVIGTPHDKWGEQVTAFVVFRDDGAADLAELKARVRERKGVHHVPKEIFVVDQLPTTNVGKINKRALRSQFWTEGERQVN